MIGFNGGLIGKDRTATALEAIGVWTLAEQLKARRNGLWPIITDPDAAAYIAAVEAADGQTLEAATRVAINLFVSGCKDDGIWDAIKASCILAGARTLAGALVPLKGTAPTNVSSLFVSGDYNRKTGLKGNGSTKHLDSNRNNNADPQNNKHLSIYITTANTVATGFPTPLGYQISSGDFSGSSLFYSGTSLLLKVNSASTSGGTSSGYVGFAGGSRANSTDQSFRAAGSTTSAAVSSVSHSSGNLRVFVSGFGGSVLNYTDARLAFYSIGESLTLASLDTRVTALINALATAIP